MALAAEAVPHEDGGGKRKAALRPIRGRDGIVRAIARVLRKLAEPIAGVCAATINGLAGFILAHVSGDLQTIAFERVHG